MPVTDSFPRVTDNLFPVTSAAFVRHIGPQIYNAYVVIAAKSIIVHNYHLQHEVLHVETWDEKLERLVEYWDKRVFLDFSFPFSEPFTIVNEVHLDIRI